MARGAVHVFDEGWIMPVDGQRLGDTPKKSPYTFNT